MQNDFSDFSMPRYKEIPNVGLYLEQVIKYINEALAPLEVSITSSMVSNYVKQGYIRRPIKKQYNADQIMYLMFVVLAKQVLSMDNIATLFALQQQTYTLPVAYDYFCSDLEEILRYQFGTAMEAPTVGDEEPFGKKALHSVVIAISQIIYLNHCFKQVREAENP